jgi:hypothetical protein
MPGKKRFIFQALIPLSGSSWTGARKFDGNGIYADFRGWEKKKLK